MSNAKGKMIRVHDDTYAGLAAIKDGMFAAYQEGRLDLPDSQAEGVSFDFVIKRLIRHFQEHGRRRAKARRKR
jgi:hypothetical protein